MEDQIAFLTPFYQSTETKPHKTFSSSLIYKILSEYYEKNDECSLSILNKCIIEKTIRPLHNRLYEGKNLTSCLLKNKYIEIDQKYNFNTMINLVHEIEHIKKLTELTNNKEYKQVNQFVYQNDLLELAPYQKVNDFLNFLIENNYCLDEVYLFLRESINSYTSFLNYFLNNEDMLKDSKQLTLLASLKDIYGNLFANFLSMNEKITIKDDNSVLINEEFFSNGEYSHKDLTESAIYPVLQLQKIENKKRL